MVEVPHSLCKPPRHQTTQIFFANIESKVFTTEMAAPMPSTLKEIIFCAPLWTNDYGPGFKELAKNGVKLQVKAKQPVAIPSVLSVHCWRVYLLQLDCYRAFDEGAAASLTREGRTMLQFLAMWWYPWPPSCDASPEAKARCIENGAFVVKWEKDWLSGGLCDEMTNLTPEGPVVEFEAGSLDECVKLRSLMLWGKFWGPCIGGLWVGCVHVMSSREPLHLRGRKY